MGQARLGRPAERDKPAEWRTRPRNKPGTAYQYNDVRVNALALAALSVWRRPLPQVLKENVMDPIGASNTWRWFGYENSWIVLDGAAGAVGHRRRSLGRRHLHQRLRHGALRVSHPAPRQVEGSSDSSPTQWVDRALTPTPVEPTTAS